MTCHILNSRQSISKYSSSPSQKYKFCTPVAGCSVTCHARQGFPYQMKRQSRKTSSSLMVCDLSSDFCALLWLIDMLHKPSKTQHESVFIATCSYAGSFETLCNYYRYNRHYNAFVADLWIVLYGADNQQLSSSSGVPKKKRSGSQSSLI